MPGEARGSMRASRLPDHSSVARLSGPGNVSRGDHADSPRTLSTWAAGLDTADKPSNAENEGHDDVRIGAQADMSWDLRTETVGPAHLGQHNDADIEDLQASHALQISHYKTLLIRAQSASSSSLHDALTRLHDLERQYATLQEEHAGCSDKRATQAADDLVTGTIAGGKDVGEVVRGLGKQERIRILGVIAEACDPSDLSSQIALLEEYRRSRFDILTRVPVKVADQILGELEVRDNLALRLVSSRHSRLTRRAAVWRELCSRMNRSVGMSAREPGLETVHWEARYRDLVTRERNWKSGLAQGVRILRGHTSSVTCLKLHGDTLISGSTDGSIRIWTVPRAPIGASQVSTPAVIHTSSVSCMDYYPVKDIIAVGFCDIGRVEVWQKRPEGWIARQALHGHSHGIRTVTLSDRYLVSAGADKVLVVWNYETGDKIIKFAQQPNLCAGLHLVHDKLISITIDGIIRTYDIAQKATVREFKLVDLEMGRSLDRQVILAKMGDGAINWVSGTGPVLTLALKTITIRLAWVEITEQVKPIASAIKAASTPNRMTSRRSTTMPSSTPAIKTPTRPRTISTRGSASFSLATPTSSPFNLSAMRTRRQEALGLGSPASPLSNFTKSHTGSVSTSRSTTITAATSVQSELPSVPKVNEPTSATQEIRVPDIARLPRILETRITPAVGRGAFDPHSGRLVASTRFTGRAESLKRLYVSEAGAGEMVSITGAWSDADAGLGLEMAAKNPLCMAIDADKIIYGCSDGSIVAVSFL